MVAEELEAELRRGGSVFRVDAGAVARHLGPGAAQRGPGDPGRAELTGWLHAVERGHDHVVYQTDADDSAWSRLCLSQADTVLLAASAETILRAAPWKPGPWQPARCAVSSSCCTRTGPRPRPGAWRDGRCVADYHHLRDRRAGDVARLARMITGTGCGLVLGSGGARRLAHLGVIRALEEAGVPIDVVGGTSMGAVMGALLALGMDHAERVHRVTTMARKGRRLLTPTLPLVPLSSAYHVDRMLAEHLGSTPIEDLPLRFFCVSANLNRAEQVIHERGPLWPAVRASMALAGVYPPVYAAGRGAAHRRRGARQHVGRGHARPGRQQPHRRGGRLPRGGAAGRRAV